jgi:cell division protein FtsA
MAKNRIVTGLDIGSYSIKALAVTNKENSNEKEVLGFIETPSFGVRRGVVCDIDKVSSRVTQVLDQLQQDIGYKIDEVCVNISGSHLFSAPSHGAIVVSRADRKISNEDVDRVFQAASALSIPPNNEVLEVFPREFIIDGHGQIKDPRGMEGVKLEAKTLALCAFAPYKTNLTSAVLNADFKISDVVPSSLASSRAVLTPQQKELGVCLLDIGAGTTDMVVFQEGDLVHAAVFPVGSNHITNDIAVGLKIDIELAEQIKKEFGSCISRSGQRKEKIEIAQGETLTFSQKVLVNIINARVSEIFNLTKQELKNNCPENSLPAGIVLTGGGAKLNKIIDFAKKELKLPVKLGVPQELDGLQKDPALSTVFGLVLTSYETIGGHRPVIRTRIPDQIKKIFKAFLP